MSTKSGHDQQEPAHGPEGKHHHHGDGQGHGHGKHHGDGQGHGHGKHHADHGHHKHPPLRDAVIKAGARAAGGGGGGGGGGAGGGAVSDHAPSHGRPRAGTISRRISVTKKEHDRQSRHSEVHLTSMIEYENTYKLIPDTRFPEGQVRQIIASVLTESLTEKDYDPRAMSRRCLELSEIIKEKVKQLDMKRFKIVCMVMIGQNSDQSMMVTSRCLWNFNFDNFSSFTLKKEMYYAIGIVFAAYTE